MRLGQGLVSQNPWRSPPPPPASSASASTRVTKPLSASTPLAIHRSLPANPPPRALPPPPPPISRLLLFEKRSSSVPTWLGLRPITCLPRNPMLRESRVSGQFPVFSKPMEFHSRYHPPTLSIALFNEFRATSGQNARFVVLLSLFDIFK